MSRQGPRGPSPRRPEKKQEPQNQGPPAYQLHQRNSMSVFDLVDFVRFEMGEANFRIAAYVLITLVCIALVFVVRGVWILLRTPKLQGQYGTGKKKPAPAAAAAKKRGDGAATPPPPQTPPQPKESADAKDKARQTAAPRTPASVARSRPLSQLEPSSAIRGIARVGVLATSPCERYLVISCRKSLKLRVYPQNTKRLFMTKGKELQVKHFVTLSDVVGDRPDVSTVAFSADGSCMALGESTTDTIYAFTTDGTAGKFEPLWQYRLPQHRLVSSLAQWSVCGDASDTLVVLHTEGAEVEVIQALSKKDAGHESRKQKFKIGSAVCWGLLGKHVAVAGSFMQDVRTATVTLRAETETFGLVNGATMHLRQAVAIALVRKGAPAFNAKDYVVVCCSTGETHIFDVSGDESPDAVPVCTFRDNDYTAADGLAAAVAGTEYHERLVVALWRGPDVVVYRQANKSEASARSQDNAFDMVRVVDLHNAHSGGKVGQATFLQYGQGLATAGTGDDSCGVRLWDLPE